MLGSSIELAVILAVFGVIGTELAEMQLCVIVSKSVWVL